MNFGGMPRGGGGRKVTRNAQICSRMRFRLCNEKRNPIHPFFFLLSRARVCIGGVSISLLSSQR